MQSTYFFSILHGTFFSFTWLNLRQLTYDIKSKIHVLCSLGNKGRTEIYTYGILKGILSSAQLYVPLHSSSTEVKSIFIEILSKQESVLVQKE